MFGRAASVAGRVDNVVDTARTTNRATDTARDVEEVVDDVYIPPPPKRNPELSAVERSGDLRGALDSTLRKGNYLSLIHI